MQTDLLKQLGVVAALIAIVQIIVHISLRFTKYRRIRNKLLHVLDRIDSWWVILFLLSGAFYFDKAGICLLFAFVSFFALREFVTLASMSSADHRAMFLMFFVILPLQYLSIFKGWEHGFNYLVPFFALVFLPFRASISGDASRFLDRTSALQWGLMTSLFCVSHIPAILLIEIPNFTQNSELLLYFILVTQISDVIQHEVGLWIGKYKIAPNISRLRTWEGWVLATLLTTILGGVLSFMTPFSPSQAILISFVTIQLSFAGCLVMSAIKRSKGIQTFDELIPGHGGALDRIDSIIFSAPVFVHLLKNLDYLKF